MLYADGRCPCRTRDADGECSGKANAGIVDDPKESYINIMFCNTFFTKPSLEERLNWGKTRPAQEKYNLDRYWHNRGL